MVPTNQGAHLEEATQNNRVNWKHLRQRVEPYTPSRVKEPTAENTLSLSSMAKPTLLAFHGSGSNDTIHSIQLARLNRFLKPHFEIESLCGMSCPQRPSFFPESQYLLHRCGQRTTPFPSSLPNPTSSQPDPFPRTNPPTAPIESDAGPGILPFFDGCGPFYRWVLPTDKIDASTAPPSRPMLPEVSSLIHAAVTRAQARGSPVVGAIGFSQGTRVVAGLLKATQIYRELAKEGKAQGLEWLDFRFGLSVCSSFPPLVLPEAVREAVEKAGWEAERREEVMGGRIRVPALHVLGAQDEWAYAGRMLVGSAYEMEVEPREVVEEGKSGVYKFEIGHHYPVATEDTEKVAKWVVGTWEGLKGE